MWLVSAKDLPICSTKVVVDCKILFIYTLRELCLLAVIVGSGPVSVPRSCFMM